MPREIESLVADYDRGKIGRRQFIHSLAVLAAASSPASAAPFQASSLNHVTLAVEDPERSRRFYESVLGSRVVSRQENGINLGLGESFPGSKATRFRPRPRSSVSRESSPPSARTVPNSTSAIRTVCSSNCRRGSIEADRANACRRRRCLYPQELRFPPFRVAPALRNPLTGLGLRFLLAVSAATFSARTLRRVRI